MTSCPARDMTSPPAASRPLEENAVVHQEAVQEQIGEPAGLWRCSVSCIVSLFPIELTSRQRTCEVDPLFAG